MLIARHGPMVLGSARRLVDKSHDAEDVFQAVFLSLARLAKTIRQGQTLPAWLHKATCRIAAKVRSNRRPRSQAELGNEQSGAEPSDESDPAAGLVWQEVRQALDQELQRLPDRLRSPLVLCYLSGLTRDEAAQQLGWSLSTLKRRLEEGRKALRIRLERRGIAAVGLALTVLTPDALQAAVSKSLIESSLGLIFSTGAAVPATISALALSSAGAMKGVAMKAIFALLVAAAVGMGIYAATGHADQNEGQNGQDRNPMPQAVQAENAVPMDDPLPAGATLRFGTSRFRHGARVAAMAVSPDGKRAFVTNDSYFSRAFDLATGQMLFSLNLGDAYDCAYSPDGRTLVVKQGFTLCVRDVATGKETRSIQLARTNPWSSEAPLEFTPDGKAIAVTTQGKVVDLIDFESGQTIRDFAHANPESGLNDFPQVLAIAFSPDGKQMATGGYANDKHNYFARLWDVETGKELRRFMHGPKGYGIRSLTFSPDGKTLATLGTQSGVFLRMFDVDTGELRKAFPKDDNLRPGKGSVAFAPDGKTVAAALNSIHLYDVSTGEVRLRIDRQATNLRFTDGGKTLTGAVGGAIYRWDTATGKALTPEGADSAVDQILVTADGKRVITRGQDGYAHIWDGASGKHLRRIAAAWQRNLAISPDGKFLAWSVTDESAQFKEPLTPDSIYYGSRFRLYDFAADKVVDRFPAFKGADLDLAFSADGKKLVTIDRHPGMVRIWDFDAAKEERSFSIGQQKAKDKAYVVVRTLLSPDGTTAAATYQEHSLVDRFGLRGPPQHTRLWDVATGTELPEVNRGRPDIQAFSLDGRLAVTTAGTVWETATGKQVAVLPDDLYIRAAAFSRDGRMLATTAPGDAIQLWETATWTKRTEFKGHRDAPTTLAFTPAGQLLSGSQDTTALAWDTRPPRTTMGSLETAWSDLAKWESADASQAEGRFLATPSEAVKFFAGKIKPVEPPDPNRIQRLLADLDSAKFAERDAASRALTDLGQQAKPYLEEAVKTTKSAEVLARAGKILEALKKNTPEQLRQLRAVLVLELIDDGEAKQLLNTWAGGLQGALLTVEAAAALQRLEGAGKGKR
jgi:RNA polymerase sigma factor (sigma-70 family)